VSFSPSTARNRAFGIPRRLIAASGGGPPPAKVNPVCSATLRVAEQTPSPPQAGLGGGAQENDFFMAAPPVFFSAVN